LKITSYKDADEDGNTAWFWKRKTKQEEAYSKKLNESLSKLKLPKLPFSD